jgi:hypothetical protein
MLGTPHRRFADEDRIETRASVALEHCGRLVERRLGLLIRHFQEQQKHQLLDAIAESAVIPQPVAVVPEFLDAGGWVAHSLIVVVDRLGIGKMAHNPRDVFGVDCFLCQQVFESPDSISVTLRQPRLLSMHQKAVHL